jgi:VanZ family protein
MKIPPFLLSKKNTGVFTLTWALIIATISSIPNLPNPEIPKNDWISFRPDYLFHFGVFFILGVAVVFWRIPNTIKFSTKTLVLILIIGSAFAIVDELHQKIIPGRRYNPIDMAYNLKGFWIGVLLPYFYIFRYLMVKKGRFPDLKKRLEDRKL